MNNRLISFALLFLGSSAVAPLSSGGLDPSQCLEQLNMKLSYKGEDATGIAYFRTHVEREPFLVYSSFGKLSFQAPIKKIINTRGEIDTDATLRDGEYFFVIGQDGQLYAAPQVFWTQWKSGKYLRHSSFFAGEPVRGAGGFIIESGKIKTISDGSGHYRPNYVQAIKTVNFLRDMNLPFAPNFRFTLRNPSPDFKFLQDVPFDAKILDGFDFKRYSDPKEFFNDLVLRQLKETMDNRQRAQIVSAYLLANKRVDTVLTENLVALVDGSLSNLSLLDSTIVRSIGRQKFFEILARKGELLEYWMSTYVFSGNRRDNLECATQVKSLLLFPDSIISKSRKLKMIRSTPERLIPIGEKDVLIQQYQLNVSE